MAHILLGSNLRDDGVLLDQLRSWGVTSTHFVLNPDDHHWPDVWTCDCVLVDSAEFQVLQASASNSDFGLAAPVLVWDGQTASAPDTHLSLPFPAIVDNRDLFASLQICLAHACHSRNTAGALPILEDHPQQVMGHEMLTPLAAIKTALEVLEQSQVAVEGEPEQKILALAARNVDRLEAAIDWSWKLLATVNNQKLGLPSVLDPSSEIIKIERTSSESTV